MIPRTRTAPPGRWRRVSFAVVFASLLASLPAACASLPDGSVREAGPDAPPRMFWTLEPDSPESGHGTLHVQGTLHLGSPELYPVDPRSLAALAASDVVLAELSLDEIAAARSLVLSRMASSSLHDGATLRSLLPPDEAAWAETFIGAPVFESLNPYEPWVASTVVDQFAASRAGLDPALGIDAALFEEASRLGKTVQGLETAEIQLRFLAGPALPLQVLLLRDSIREYRDHPATLRALYEAYRDDDRTALAREVIASTRRSAAFAPALAEFNEALLAGRNADWADRIADLLDEGRIVYLFAGAAHFVGTDNLLELLSTRGYRQKAATAHP